MPDTNGEEDDGDDSLSCCHISLLRVSGMSHESSEHRGASLSVIASRRAASQVPSRVSLDVVRRENFTICRSR